MEQIYVKNIFFLGFKITFFGNHRLNIHIPKPPEKQIGKEQDIDSDDDSSDDDRLQIKDPKKPFSKSKSESRYLIFNSYA